MKLKFVEIWQSIPPVMVDGALYAGLAIFIALQGSLSSDEAAKYVTPTLLFWMRTAVAALAAGAGALKMFRSNSYADYSANKKTTDSTTQILKKQLENG